MHLCTSSAACIPESSTMSTFTATTRKGEDVDKMMSTFRRKLGGMPVKLVSIDVEYTHYVKPQRAAVLQLCVEKECLVYHISTAKDRSE